MMWIKVIKLIGLFRREPFDIIFLPLSIMFGYFHGFIKIYAGLTHRMVSCSSALPNLSLIEIQTSWGSREDGDTNDSERMSPRNRRSESITSPPSNQPGLVLYNDGKMAIYSPDEKEQICVSTVETAMSPDHARSDTDNDQLESRSNSSDDSYYDDSNSSSMVMAPLGR